MIVGLTTNIVLKLLLKGRFIPNWN